MSPLFKGFKKRLTQRPLRPVFPSQKAMIEEREKEGQRTPLFDLPRQGRDITVSNVTRDAVGAINDLRRSPQTFASKLKSRLGRYVDRGPDINNPIPLTKNPYRGKRR